MPNATLLLVAGRVAALVIHELAHALVALLLGIEACPSISPASYFLGNPGGSTVVKKDISDKHHAMIRHAGWVASVVVAMALAIQAEVPPTVTFSFWWVAADALTSDLFKLHRPLPRGCTDSGVFFCGNFGLLIVSYVGVRRTRVLALLRHMLRVTMMRGAQSAGVVTYDQHNGSLRGHRSRVVNGKRTDLGDLLVSSHHPVQPDYLRACLIACPRG